MSQEIIELLKKALKKGKDNLPNTWEINKSLDLLKEQPPASEFTKKCRAMAEVAIESTDKLTEEKLTELLDSDWNGVGFIMRVFGDLLEGRLAAKDALEACDRLDASEASCKELKELLTEYGRHSPGCSQEFGSKYHCRCGWSKVEANKQGD